MRNLFTQILIFGAPENPKLLWETFKEKLAEDFIREARVNSASVVESIKRAIELLHTNSIQKQWKAEIFYFGLSDTIWMIKKTIKMSLIKKY